MVDGSPGCFLLRVQRTPPHFPVHDGAEDMCSLFSLLPRIDQVVLRHPGRLQGTCPGRFRQGGRTLSEFVYRRNIDHVFRPVLQITDGIACPLDLLNLPVTFFAAFLIIQIIVLCILRLFPGYGDAQIFPCNIHIVRPVRLSGRLRRGLLFRTVSAAPGSVHRLYADLIGLIIYQPLSAEARNIQRGFRGQDGLLHVPLPDQHLVSGYIDAGLPAQINSSIARLRLKSLRNIHLRPGNPLFHPVDELHTGDLRQIVILYAFDDQGHLLDGHLAPE